MFSFSLSHPLPTTTHEHPKPPSSPVQYSPGLLSTRLYVMFQVHVGPIHIQRHCTMLAQCPQTNLLFVVHLSHKYQLLLDQCFISGVTPCISKRYDPDAVVIRVVLRLAHNIPNSDTPCSLLPDRLFRLVVRLLWRLNTGYSTCLVIWIVHPSSQHASIPGILKYLL